MRLPKIFLSLSLAGVLLAGSGCYRSEVDRLQKENLELQEEVAALKKRIEGLSQALKGLAEANALGVEQDKKEDEQKKAAESKNE